MIWRDCGRCLPLFRRTETGFTVIAPLSSTSTSSLVPADRSLDKMVRANWVSTRAGYTGAADGHHRPIEPVFDDGIHRFVAERHRQLFFLQTAVQIVDLQFYNAADIVAGQRFEADDFIQTV